MEQVCVSLGQPLLRKVNWTCVSCFSRGRAQGHDSQHFLYRPLFTWGCGLEWMGHLHQEGKLETPQPDAESMYLPPIDLDNFWRESQKLCQEIGDLSSGLLEGSQTTKLV